MYPSQESFIQVFEEILKVENSRSLPVFNCSVPNLHNVRIIQEPPQRQREGRTTALARLFEKLFIASFKEPLQFVLDYIGLPNYQITECFFHLSILIPLIDIRQLVEERLIALYLQESVAKYKIYYLTPYIAQIPKTEAVWISLPTKSIVTNGKNTGFSGAFDVTSNTLLIVSNHFSSLETKFPWPKDCNHCRLKYQIPL